MDLVKWNQAKNAIAQCKTIDEVKEIRDKAEAMRAYAKQAHESLEMQNDIAEIKIRAERRAGEILSETDLQHGSRGVGKKVELHDVTTLADLGIQQHESSRWQQIADIPEKQFENHIQETKQAKEELTTASTLRLAKEIKGKPEALVTKFTGEQENYTPENIIKAVYDVIDNIDLDPASCEFANKIIKADEFFTEDIDGLKQDWLGNIFLNPPYQMPEIRLFTDKLIEQLPNISQAIVLTNNNTDTLWFHKCANNAEMLCLTKGRINFYKTDVDKTYPTNGQAFFYFGKHRDRFASIFKNIGIIVQVIK